MQPSLLYGKSQIRLLHTRSVLIKKGPGKSKQKKKYEYILAKLAPYVDRAVDRLQYFPSKKACQQDH
jgi:hypothetical protein